MVECSPAAGTVTRVGGNRKGGEQVFTTDKPDETRIFLRYDLRYTIDAITCKGANFFTRRKGI